jgi:hypothetical protein
MYAHGLYNLLIIFLFLYQGWLGFKIRKDRMRDNPPAVKIVKRHRKLGPIFSILGITGLLSGLTVAYIAYRRFFILNLHFFGGSIITILIAINYFFSRKIKGVESSWKTAHFVSGVTLICFYLVQAFLGVVMLF